MVDRGRRRAGRYGAPAGRVGVRLNEKHVDVVDGRLGRSWECSSATPARSTSLRWAGVAAGSLVMSHGFCHLFVGWRKTVLKSSMWAGRGTVSVAPASRARVRSAKEPGTRAGRKGNDPPPMPQKARGSGARSRSLGRVPRGGHVAGQREDTLVNRVEDPGDLREEVRLHLGSGVMPLRGPRRRRRRRSASGQGLRWRRPC